MVQEGSVGNLRKVMIDYSQGWLSQLVENEGNKQASWRTDPKFSGIGGTIADIGTHAFNMAEYVANDRVSEIVAQVSTLVEGRKIDDDTNVLLNFKNGATGTLSVSQVCTGEDNALSLQVYGEKGALLWNHSQPKTIIKKAESEEKIIEVRESDIDISEASSRLPAGHPESFLKGFINIYDNFIESINTGKNMQYPDIVDGVRGMLFIEKAIESSKKRVWIDL